MAFINPPINTKVIPVVYKVYQNNLGATIFESFDNIFRDQNKIDLYEELGILTAQKEFIDTYRQTVFERDNLKRKLDVSTKPVLIVEGKTDKWILDCACRRANGKIPLSYESSCSNHCQSGELFSS